MHDIRAIRENPAAFDAALSRRGDAAMSSDILALDEALAKLAVDEPIKAKLVTLRYFAGLTMPQAAEALGVSVATVENDWAYAKSWLRLRVPNDGQT